MNESGAAAGEVHRALQDVRRRVELFEQSSSPSVVLSDEATEALNVLLALVSEGGATLEVLRAAGRLCWQRYLVLPRGRDQRSLELAAQLLQPVHQEHPEAVPAELRTLYERGRAEVAAVERHERALDLIEEFQTTGAQDVLHRALDLLRSIAAAVVIPDHRANCLSNLAYGLRMLYDFTGEPATLHEALYATRSALACATDDPGIRANIMNNMANALIGLHEVESEPGHLTEAIELLRTAVDLVEPGHPERVLAFGALASALRSVVDATGSASALTETLACRRAAIQAYDELAGSPLDHGVDVAPLWANLGGDLVHHYSRSHDVSLLRESLDVMRRAIEVSRPGDPYLPMRYNNLAGALSGMFDETGDTTHLDHLVEARRAALLHTAEGHPDHPLYLSQLGSALLDCYWHGTSATHVGEAGTLIRRAILANTQPSRHPSLLSNLCTLLTIEYETRGSLDRLAEAVQAGRESVRTTPRHDPRYVAHVANLANALARFAEVSGQAVFAEAIEVSRELLSLAPRAGAVRGHHEANVAMLLALSHVRDGGAETLAQALAAARRAVRHTPDGHAALAMRKDILSWVLRLRYQSSKDRAVLLECISYARQALMLTAEHQPPFGPRLSNLAGVMLGLFTETGDDTALALAVELSRRAVRAVPSTEAYRCNALLQLGSALESLAADEAPPHLLNEAAEAYAECADSTAGSARQRVRAARSGALVLMKLGRSEQAAHAVETLVMLLPQALGRHLDRAEREYLLADMPGLAMTVGGIMVAAGRPERAVELLEQTRGILFAEAVDGEKGVTALRAEDPELADRCEALLAEFVELDRAASSTQSPVH
ncbi:hypothetical protein [Streptomyces sp. NPDC050546]|uniref:hypothetical protein n=1 Tax=Streptomyces sp. NPDC050546 TaxID=3365628 RepID=UPI0037AAAEA3